ncbi:MAG: CBS domain-containing protein [Haloferacaceae archaeon]|nr:CBS domain-containing protein [Haloferacaceae archaeon]
MDISTIATDEYVEVDPSERASKIRSIFERDRPRGVLVTEDEEVRGVIGQQQLIRSHLEDTTQAHALMRSAPTLTTDTDVREVARLLVEGDVKVAPVEDDSGVVGIVSIDAILQAVLPNLAAIDVEDIYTTAVTTIDDGAHLGRAINLFREGGISRLPVTDAEEGTLVGILTTVDILDFVTRREHRQGRRDRRGDLDRMLDLPVYDLMSAPVEQVSGEATVEEAVRQMFDAGFSGLVVTDGADRVAGIITKTDVLRALSYTEETQMDVQITNIALLETLQRSAVTEAIRSVAAKYQEMDVLHAHVRFHEHKEKLRGTPLILCKIRLRTSHGQMAGTGEGYGAEHAFRLALDTLERNVLETKGVIADERYEGELIRKLEQA